MERLIFLETAALDRDVALQHYMQVREESIKRANEKVKDKGIEEGDLVLRYNSRLDKTMQKKFQIKWEGPFKVVQKFAHNGTFQLADLDGLLHAYRVNGSRLKKYIARLMTVVQDIVPGERELILPILTVEEDYGPALQFLFLTADHE